MRFSSTVGDFCVGQTLNSLKSCSYDVARGSRPHASGEAQQRTMPFSQPILVVFVHGFRTNAQCWDQLVTLLDREPRFRASFHYRRFEYATRWFQFNFLRRIPSLKDIADQLRTFLDLEANRVYERVMLVGHSQGGLVIQSYLTEELNHERGAALERIVQAIFICTPNLGSTLFSGLRRLLFWINPQEHSLRVLNEEISRVHRAVLERIENATVNDNTHRQIPIKCFWGDQDRVVLPASAKGQFENVTALSGDHFSVLRPANAADQNFLRILEALLSPSGHKSVHDVDAYDTRIQVRPVLAGSEYDFPTLKRVRHVVTDNVASIRRSIRFAGSNRCKSTFVLRYATRNDGFITMKTSHANLADPAEVGRYEDNGIEATFRFEPKREETFVLELEVYKGFDENHRDFHMHIPKQAHFRQITVTLDVSPYLATGWIVSRQPELFLHAEDHGHSDLCRNRTSPGRAENVTGTALGCWSWKIEDVSQGVIDLRWDVARGQAKSPSS